jgi:hypothetical protein
MKFRQTNDFRKSHSEAAKKILFQKGKAHNKIPENATKHLNYPIYLTIKISLI